MVLVIKILSLIAFVILFLLAIFKPDPASIAGAITALVSFASTFILSKKYANSKQNVSGRSVGLQAGGNININIADGSGRNHARHLQLGKLAANLKTFNGLYIRVENDPQNEQFAEEFRSAIRLIGLQTNGGDIIVDPARFLFEGIQVLVQQEKLSSEDLAPAGADVIVRELRRQNCMVNRMPPDGAPQTNFIRIRIGSLIC